MNGVSAPPTVKRLPRGRGQVEGRRVLLRLEMVRPAEEVIVPAGRLVPGLRPGTVTTEFANVFMK